MRSSPGPGPRPGTVYLVGAGPGDPGLVTVRAAELLAGAEVVVYDGLVNTALLELAPAAAERIYAGKKRGRSEVIQHGINQTLIERAQAGRAVVRLKGGDPFMFGRGGEECQALADAGVPFEVVPGVSAATAVAAYAGIPLTHRDVASTVAFATAHEADDKGYAAVDAAELARFGTVVLFMGVQSLAASAAQLIGAGRAADTPVAVIRWGTLPAQRVVVGTLADIAERARDLRPPGLVVIGGVVNLRAQIAWAEKRALHGVRVVVTRPRAQAGALLTELSRLGADAIACPVIACAAAEDPGPLGAALARVRDYQAIALTSANAVEAVWARLGDARGLAGPLLCALGGATAEALAAHGLVADVSSPDTGRGARALAERMVAAGALGRVLFPRAADGREELVAALTSAGATVNVVTAYRTVRVPAAELEAPLARIRAGEVDAISFLSPSAVDALCALVGEGPLAAIKLVVNGDTTAAALAAHGLAPAARGGLLSALATLFPR